MPEDQKKDKKTRIHRSIITGLSASAVAAVVAVASAFFSCQAVEWNVNVRSATPAMIASRVRRCAPLIDESGGGE